MESLGWMIFWYCVVSIYILMVHAFALAGILLLMYGDPDKKKCHGNVK